MKEQVKVGTSTLFPGLKTRSETTVIFSSKPNRKQSPPLGMTALTHTGLNLGICWGGGLTPLIAADSSESLA